MYSYSTKKIEQNAIYISIIKFENFEGKKLDGHKKKNCKR